MLCRRSITLEQLDDADKFLIVFCLKFEQLYGQQYCNMNIHLHGHISDCIRDVGPVYAFWLFTFERLNGILGSYHTNCHDISLQLMRRFLVNHDYGFSNWPEEYRDEFEAIISQCQYNKGSLSFKCLSDSMLSKNLSSFPPIHEMTWQAHQKAALHPITVGWLDIIHFLS